MQTCAAKQGDAPTEEEPHAQDEAPMQTRAAEQGDALPTRRSLIWVPRSRSHADGGVPQLKAATAAHIAQDGGKAAGRRHCTSPNTTRLSGPEARTGPNSNNTPAKKRRRRNRGNKSWEPRQRVLLTAGQRGNRMPAAGCADIDVRLRDIQASQYREMEQARGVAQTIVGEQSHQKRVIAVLCQKLGHSQRAAKDAQKAAKDAQKAVAALRVEMAAEKRNTAALWAIIGSSTITSRRKPEHIPEELL
jgi:hypothetical protein